jgi:hypothetical protein
LIKIYKKKLLKNKSLELSSDNLPHSLKQKFKNLILPLNPEMGLKKEDPLPPWGQTHFQTGAYLSSTICGKHLTNNFYQNISITKILHFLLMNPIWIP